LRGEKAWERLTGFLKLRKNKKGEWIRERLGRGSGFDWLAVPCPSIALNNLGFDGLTRLTNPKKKIHKKKKALRSKYPPEK